ncbi:thiamine phosphate synthase [Virgibacillus sp. MSP4-1]|uniref:thiamine phosphate synthase n=1 Tax=Virgibacillus sp. MSP4-1 TaxID=2700081 RepID=UPI00039FB5E6|nr:thiamine phosphate synthase [Virgibacillus sp. MSP4-1]QHS21890.1 thiamine phosphate synthase [Virgibacillus sp. MSP4-1]
MNYHKIKEYLSLYFIMGSVNCRDHNPVNVLKQAIEGGITLFQYREKGEAALKGREKYHLAEELQKICADAKIPFIVNDDVELAIELEADGIHVGQDDEAARFVRGRMKNKILGVSAHTIDEAHQAIYDGADYLGIGPIFPTSSKADAKKAQGPELIKHFRNQEINIPLVGIGGITSANAQEVIETGADGVSVISAIAGAKDIRKATEEFKIKFRS